MRFTAKLTANLATWEAPPRNMWSTLRSQTNLSATDRLLITANEFQKASAINSKRLNWSQVWPQINWVVVNKRNGCLKCSSEDRIWFFSLEKMRSRRGARRIWKNLETNSKDTRRHQREIQRNLKEPLWRPRGRFDMFQKMPRTWLTEWFSGMICRWSD